ncbi:MAG: protein kinase [Planctomycetes bacterium]|nr:protein kinase [Planctomycetota bacterium]
MRLTVETGPLAGTVVTLDREHPTLLGSGPDCAIRIEEAGVAPQHAVVKALKDQGFGVKALAAGLRVNGASIEASPLQDGDVIELGTTRVAFGQTQKRGLPQIAGYRIIEELGRGGMGMVYRAEQVSLHREIALKVLNKDLTQDPAFVAKFVAEARAAAKLQHPNVVAVFDVEHDGGTYYYAMELMHEGSLEDWLKQNGAMPVDRALRVVADAAAGLAYAESLGIVHRDIKPDNLMLDQHGSVKIADLGLANTSGDAETKAVGTPHFMAPEQVLRKAVDHRTDLYALGCTFYRLVTGRTPFPRKTVKDILAAQVKEDAEPANKVNPEVPAEVAAIIQKLMAKDPAARHQTANELLEELEILLQPPVKKGMWIALAGAAVLIAGGAIWWAVTKPKDVETRIEYADNPEAARLAKENSQLKQEVREATATIALLSLRLADLAGEDLAKAFDRLGADHAGTRAAVEATERAARTRAEAAEKARAGEQRRTMVADQLSALRQAMQAPLDAADFAGALRAIATPAEDALRGDADLESGRKALRDQVLERARARLASLQSTADDAAKAKDSAGLTAACDAWATALGAANRWPDELANDVQQAATRLASARTALAGLVAERGTSAWQRYHALFPGEAGIVVLLRRFDFAAAATLANGFASAAPEPAIADAARTLVATIGQAGTFVVAMDRAAGAGQLTFTGSDGTSMPIGRWDRAQQQLVLLDQSKKPPREVPTKTAGLSFDAWRTIAEQVQTPPQGSRECFLGLLAIVQHADAARDFLGRLRADDDASGTGTNGYSLGAVMFEPLLRALPEQDTEPWVIGLRRELQATQRLVAGLRALSERRNLAAASHVDRLLAESPHAFIVAALP